MYNDVVAQQNFYCTSYKLPKPRRKLNFVSRIKPLKANLKHTITSLDFSILGSQNCLAVIVCIHKSTTIINVMIHILS